MFVFLGVGYQKFRLNCFLFHRLYSVVSPSGDLEFYMIAQIARFMYSIGFGVDIVYVLCFTLCVSCVAFRPFFISVAHVCVAFSFLWRGALGFSFGSGSLPGFSSELVDLAQTAGLRWRVKGLERWKFFFKIPLLLKAGKSRIFHIV